MARNFVAASSQYLEISSALVTSYPFACSAWFTSTLSDNMEIFSLGDSTASKDYFQFQINSSGAVDAVQRSGGGASQANTTVTYSSGIAHAGCYFAGDTSRGAIINGGNLQTDSGSQSFPTVNTTRLGRRVTTLAFQGYMDGDIGNFALLSVVPTTDQWTALGLGVDPRFLFKGSEIVDYWDLTRSLVGINGNTWTDNSTTVQDDFGKIFFMPRPHHPITHAAAGFTSTFASTLDDVAMAASAALEFPSTFSDTLEDVIMAATGAADFVGAFASTLDDATMAASAALEFSGTFASTLDDVVMAAVGSSGIDGAFASTLDDATMAASAALEFPSAFASTLDDVAMAAAGSAPIIGTSAVTLEDATMAASGTVTNISTGTARGRLRWRKVWLEGEKVKLGDLHKNEEAVSEFALEAINVGGLARKMALPYVGKSRTKTIKKLSNNAKELKVLIKLYEREKREREREEELLLF